ncbi:MAG: 30S ribosomal protein S6 [Phycisphaerae bacterium]
MARTTINQYEAMFLFPAGAATEVENTLATARKFLEAHGAQVAVLKKWDERKLTYELKNNKRGVYISAYFTAPTSAITAIERDVKLSEDVLRVLILKADHLSADEIQNHEPQKPEPREERPERGFGGGFGGGGGYGGDRGDRGGDRGGDRPGYGGPRGRRDEAPAAAPAPEAGADKD